MPTDRTGLKVSVSIHRRDRTGVELTLVDENSRAHFLTLTMSSQDFLNAVMGLGYVDATVDLCWLDRLGTKHENKKETIVADNDRLTSEWVGGNHTPTAESTAYLNELLQPYEVDGWRAHREDFFNHHRRKRVKNQWVFEVAFHRWVPTPEPAHAD